MSIEIAAAPVLLPEEVQETPYYIPATSPTTRPRRILKHGDTFAVIDSHGDIGATAGGSDGLFHKDTRFLARLELLINGMQPLLLGSNVRDDNTVMTVDLTNPDMFSEGRLILPKDTLHIVRTIFLWQGAAYQRIALRNHGELAVPMHLSLTFGSDFADLFEVRGMRREKRGAERDPAVDSSEVRLSYAGLDGNARQTQIRFDPPPSSLSGQTASYRIRIATVRSHDHIPHCCVQS